MCSKERWIGFFKYYAMEKNLGVVLDSPKFDFEHITELKKKKKKALGSFLTSMSFMEKVICFNIHHLVQWFSILAVHWNLLRSS